MKYILDNDLHIHSMLSACSSNPEQNKDRILAYAVQNNLKTICVTDHFWDDVIDGPPYYYVNNKCNFEYLSQNKPLPQTQDVRFLFGCEADLNKDLVLGVSKEKMDMFDFIGISITHFPGVECPETAVLYPEEAADVKSRANAWVKRFDTVLSMNLPFEKIGFAHLTCVAIGRTRQEYIDVINAIPTEEMERLFKKAALLGVGIELNATDMSFADDEADVVLRPYRIAKKNGCKFYCGSDAHHPDRLEIAKSIFERAINLLELTEEDKFVLKG